MFVVPTVNKRENKEGVKPPKKCKKWDDANDIRKLRALNYGWLGGSSLWSQESQESQLAPEYIQCCRNTEHHCSSKHGQKVHFTILYQITPQCSSLYQIVPHCTTLNNIARQSTVQHESQCTVCLFFQPQSLLTVCTILQTDPPPLHKILSG